jgi:hypothetical protein
MVRGSLVYLWDDELESLSDQVRVIFGDAAVLDAMVRAVQLTPTAWNEDGRLETSAVEEVEEGDAISVADAIVILKAELRRLLITH